MSAFLSQQNIVQTTDFVTRVRHAAVKVALAVCSEPGNSANNAARVALAAAALAAPASMARLIAIGVVTNGAISTASTDADLELAVSSLWDAYSKTLAPGASAA